MTEKRFFKALFKTVLFFAFLHVILLFVLAVTSVDLSYLNIFYISGLSEFFPGIEDGFLSFLISIIVITVVYFLFYRKIKNKR